LVCKGSNEANAALIAGSRVVGFHHAATQAALA
jgi:hypothetical protein